jgi:hypothetical protein
MQIFLRYNLLRKQPIQYRRAIFLIAESRDRGSHVGCMSRDPNDPQVNLNEKPIAQLWDCLSLLAPPLRLAKIAAIAATDGLEKNIPETTARLTGGEYFKLSNTKSFERDLASISNHIPNPYVLSFQPQSRHPSSTPSRCEYRATSVLKSSQEVATGQNPKIRRLISLPARPSDSSPIQSKVPGDCPK